MVAQGIAEGEVELGEVARDWLLQLRQELTRRRYAEHLFVVRAEYRLKLRGYIESQLRDLDSSGESTDNSPASSFQGFGA